MTTAPEANHGFVLSAGGALGAYSVGVINALARGESPSSAGRVVDPMVVTGTSIGAFIAACLLSYEGDIAVAAGNLKRIWLDEVAGDNFGVQNGAFRVRGNPLEYFSPRRFLRSPFEGARMMIEDGAVLGADWSNRAAVFLRSSESIPLRVLKLFGLSAFVSTSPLAEVIVRNVSFQRLRESDRAIALVATNATNGRLRVFHNRDLTDEDGLRIVLASAAIPGFLPPIELGDDKYIDGAVLAYTKLAPAINAGARIIHLVHVDPEVANVAITDPEATVDTQLRMNQVQWASRVGRGMSDSGRINHQVAFLKNFVRQNKLSPSLAGQLFRAMIPPGSFDSKEPDEVPVRITVHRYFPHGADPNPLAMLNFGRRQIAALIREGYDDTVGHDCERSKCIIPLD